jgi:hypothetical protein
MANYTTNHNTNQYNKYVLGQVAITELNCSALQNASCSCFNTKFVALPAALLWQQLGKLIYTCIWVEIAQSATDTTEGGDEISHCLQAFARWQKSSYPISIILNPSGLNRPELESDNSPPLNAWVKKTWTPYIVPCLIQDVSFIAVLSTAAYRTESPHSPGHLVTAALLRDTVKDSLGCQYKWLVS